MTANLELKKATFLRAARLLALGLAGRGDDDEPTTDEWAEAFGVIAASSATDEARAIVTVLATEVLAPVPKGEVQ
jgi:hypothetical protein